MSSSTMIAVLSVLMLAVAASGQQTNCSTVVSDFVGAFSKNSSLAGPFTKIIPAGFNGTALVPTTKAFEAALTAIFQAASSQTKLTITSLPAGMTNASLLESEAFQDLLKFHLLYTYGMDPPNGAKVYSKIPSMLKSTDKGFCLNGPASTSMDIRVSAKFAYSFNSPVNNASGLSADYSQKADCENAGAFLIDTVLLPCDLDSSALVKSIGASYTAAAKANSTKTNQAGPQATAAGSLSMVVAAVLLLVGLLA